VSGMATSQRASKSALAAARGGIGRQLLVFSRQMCYHIECSFTSFLKQNAQGLATPGVPSRQMEAQMTTCNNSSKCTTDSQNWEYPSPLKLYSFSCVNGGAR
jgi:hypothetical protein